MPLSKLSLILLTCFIVFSCNSDDNNESCDLSAEATNIRNRIFDSYKKSCDSCLKTLLDDWGNEFEAITNFPDSLRPIYEVYNEAYSPWALERMSNSEWGNGIYANISYYIIQDSISYDYNFDEDYIGEVLTVKPFRPAIANDTITTLYLNEDYRDAINCFLGTYEFTQHTEEEKLNRYRFLNNYLLFFHGHWANYWHLETHPEIYRISFNKTIDKAKVYFRIGYQGGEIILDKNNSTWEIIDWRMTWIE